MERFNTAQKALHPILETETRVSRVSLNRRRFLTLAVAAASNIACSTDSRLRQLVVTSPTPLPKPTEVSLPKATPNASAWDYCKSITHESSSVDQAIAGTQIPPKIIYPDISKEIVSSFNINSSEIIISGTQDQNKLNFILFPLGYDNEELAVRMSQISDVLKLVFKGVNVDFVYLNKSVPLGVQSVDRLATLIDGAKFDQILNKAQVAASVDKGLVVFKYPEHMGSCCPPIISGNGAFSLATITHEVAHRLNLYDGYQKQFLPEEFPNEEVFTRVELLQPAVRRAYEKHKPQIVPTGNVCNGENVYRFSFGQDYDQNDVMRHIILRDEEFLNRVRQARPFFNPLQVDVMNEYIKGQKAA